MVNEIFPQKLNSLPSEYRKEKCKEIIRYLKNHQLIDGVLLGGSVTYKKNIEKSDIDFFCLVSKTELLEFELVNKQHSLTDVDTIISQGFFPWTEKLYTIYYKKDRNFSIDLCLIDFKNKASFFWEPDGVIVFDRNLKITNTRKKQVRRPSFSRQPFLKTNPFSFSIITLKKIEKNLTRGHLWNALEQLNKLRKYIMQIIRLYVLKDKSFLGRVNRDLEDVITPEYNSILSKTVAIYDKEDIISKTLLLIELLFSLKNNIKEGEEIEFESWILRNLEYEKTKLIQLKNA